MTEARENLEGRRLRRPEPRQCPTKDSVRIDNEGVASDALSNKTTVQAMLRDSLMSFALPGDISSLCELLCFSRPRRAKINAGAESE